MTVDREHNGGVDRPRASFRLFPVKTYKPGGSDDDPASAETGPSRRLLALIDELAEEAVRQGMDTDQLTELLRARTQRSFQPDRPRRDTSA